MNLLNTIKVNNFGEHGNFFLKYILSNYLKQLLIKGLP